MEGGAACAAPVLWRTIIYELICERDADNMFLLWPHTVCWRKMLQLDLITWQTDFSCWSRVVPQLYNVWENLQNHKTAHACLCPEDSLQGTALHTEPALFPLIQLSLFTVASGSQTGPVRACVHLHHATLIFFHFSLEQNWNFNLEGRGRLGFNEQI